MKKRRLSLALVVCLILTLIPAVGAVEEVPGSDTLIASGQCGENVFWELYSNGTMIISGSGSMEDYLSAGGRPGEEYRDRITQLVIQEGVTTVGRSAFSACTGITTLVIPESVREIGAIAFKGCTALREVEIRSRDIYLGSRAFTGCTALVSVTVPRGELRLDATNPFMDTPFMKAAMDSSGFNILGQYLLYYGGTEAEPVIPAAVKYIGSQAFQGNHNILRLTIPEGVTEIADMAFDYCVNLREVVIPAGMEKIGQYAFSQNQALERITFWGDYVEVHDQAFLQTTTHAYIPSGNGTWPMVVPWCGNNITLGTFFTTGCKHTETLAQPGLEPDCFTPGSTHRAFCRKCGQITAEQAVSALGHEYMDGVCTRCGEAGEARKPGDVTGEGNADYNDALIILRYSIGLETLEGEALAAADVTGEGKVDYNDALKVLRMSIGLPT